MSSYTRETKHPNTGKWEEANWIDDMFGRHCYGVVFPSDREREPHATPLRSIAFNPNKVQLETRAFGENDDKVEVITILSRKTGEEVIVEINGVRMVPAKSS